MKYLVFILFVLSVACNTSKPSEVKLQDKDEKHYSIKDSAGFRIITIKEPFLNANIVERYVLYSKLKGKPKGVSADVFIGTPIERIGINSTTHLGFLTVLNQQHKIVGASNAKLFYDSSFQQRVAEGKVTELGNRTLNHEKIIASELDVLFTFAIDAASYKTVKQLREVGQPAVLISEFNESYPINKAMWLEVFGAFFDENTQQVADNHLSMVQANYDSIKSESMLYSFLPQVTIGLPWKGTWHVSGAESYQAQLIRDAGAVYCWQQYKQSQSVPLDIETAVSKGFKADFWINTGTIRNSDELKKSNAAFAKFTSFEQKNIYSNYKRSNSLGANDYWEQGVVRPDLILGDLITIFHNGGDSSLTFYENVFK